MRVLRELRRALKPSGLPLLETVNYRPHYEITTVQSVITVGGILNLGHGHSGPSARISVRKFLASLAADSAFFLSAFELDSGSPYMLLVADVSQAPPRHDSRGADTFRYRQTQRCAF